MKFTCVLIILLLILNNINAQDVSNDHNYELDVEDNFNYFNSNLWNKTPWYTWGQEQYIPENVDVANGILTLKCERIISYILDDDILKNASNIYNDSVEGIKRPTVITSYISGGIQTVHKKSFSYGYFEIESKIPNKSRGYWGGFWLQSGSVQTNDYYEIDIFEPDGCDCELATQYHNGSISTTDGITEGSESNIIKVNKDISESFNKYAVLWTPTRVEFYFNGELMDAVINPKHVPTGPMYVYLTFQINKPTYCGPYLSSIFPAYWEFKNFKYYKLKTDCSVPIIANNFDFLNHDYKVYKYYSIGNSAIPSNSDIILHAKDYIELKGGFSIPFGSTLTAITHCYTCPD